jgi:hypothetical protein
MKRLLVLAAVLTLAVGPATAETASKDGTPVIVNPGDVNEPSPTRSDFEYNTGGVIDFVPDSGGSSSGWGEWFIGTVFNDTGQDICLQELGFPCAGPPTEDFGWLVWLDVGGYVPPAGDAYSAHYYGAFTPVDPNPETWPPTTYTYIDVSGEGIMVAAGTYFCIGYDNTGMGGQTSYNGVETWAWYGGMWDPDSYWGRTAILQVKANFGVTPADDTTWGSVKALFR